jgi:putative addiction module component (TIGR02574 family)
MSLQDILNMPPSDRIDLVEQIWDSIKPEDIEISKAQKKELDRRISLHEEGEAEWLSYDDVKARLSKKFK